ncbi:MAG: protein-export chaperone SecB [Gammaproteobacteria bacterium]|nr:protein-export chaperone SecB [Gammaproteobacteria bacterium]
MAEEQKENGGNGEAAGNGAGGGQRFALELIYVKDLSFEVPNAPEVYSEKHAETQVNMNLQNAHKLVADDSYEVSLSISLHATLGERTMFMVELEQAGLFRISGFPDNTMRQLISATCPATLFPYARESVSSTIARGGFPAILLQPINFDALFSQAEAERGRADA